MRPWLALPVSLLTALALLVGCSAIEFELPTPGPEPAPAPAPDPDPEGGVLTPPPSEALSWKWSTDRAVPVCWTNAVPPRDSRYDDEVRKKQIAREVVEEEWARFSALSFSGWGDCGAGSERGIKIEIMWEDRGDTNSAGRTNPASYLGRADILAVQRSGAAGMYLQFDAPDHYVRSSALHEFGHALGFQHAHRQGESDPVCRALHPEQDGDRARDNAEFLAESYDANSIMSYCPTFGQFFDAISEQDARGIQRHYGAGPGGPVLKAATERGGTSCPDKYPASGGQGAAFLHVFNNTCWSCPSGFSRTANPDVASRNACRKPGERQAARATLRGNATGLIKTDCPRGQFLHGLSGKCYSCPDGFRRSTAGINASNACVRTTQAELRAGTRRGAPGCPSDAFAHGLTGRCYSCGDGHVRTAVLADRLESEPRACVRRDWGLVRMTTLPWRILSTQN